MNLLKNLVEAVASIVGVGATMFLSIGLIGIVVGIFILFFRKSKK